MTVAEPLRVPAGPSGWRLARSRWLPEEDGFYESLFALADGRVGVRATVDFEAGGGTPGCFCQGLYGPGTEVPSELVNGFNPAYWSLTLDGVPLTLASAVEFAQELDMAEAVTRLSLRLADHAGRSTRAAVTTLLCAGRPGLMMTLFELEAEHDAPLRLLSGVDWRWGNGAGGDASSPRRLLHLDPSYRRWEPSRLAVCAAVRGTGRHVAVATAHLTHAGGAAPVAGRTRLLEALAPPAGHRGPWQVVRLAMVAVESTAEAALAASRERLEAAVALGPRALLAAHRAAWQGRWEAQGIELDAPDEDVEAVRFGLFHLLQAPERGAAATNLPARGLTSEHHSGHVFFNSDLFLVPFYALVEPPVARALVTHRVATLEAAVRHARATGLAGARYPLRCDLAGHPSPTAEEAAGPPSLHLSADVLYGLHRYLESTGDAGALDARARGMVAGIAELYAGLLAPDPRLGGGLGIRGVLGFDEFHGPVDHHAATNFMAAWALRWAAAALATPEPAGERRARWLELAGRVALPPAGPDGVLPEFLGYLELPDRTVERPPGHRLPRPDAGGAGTGRLIKQADVVLLLSLFPGAFDIEAQRASWSFYDRRTLHASSLSPGPHGAVAARIGRVEEAREWILAGLRYNLDFTPRSAYGNGVHLAGYAAALLALVEGVLGLAGDPSDSDGLRLAPVLPAAWRRVRLRLWWRGCRLDVEVLPERVAVSCERAPDPPLRLTVWESCRIIRGEGRTVVVERERDCATAVGAAAGRGIG